MSSGRSLVKPMPAMAAATTESFTTRRFAVACDVLSKCVKAGTTPPLQQAAGPGTTAFMPGAPAAVHERPRAAAGGGQQLTIFYSGRVVVIDGCTPEKASELIRYAAAAAAPAPQSVPEPAPAPQSVPEPAPALVDMPIARKASLKRFLAKRKDRSAPAPAQASSGRTAEEPSPAKKRKTVERREEASSWLTLGSLGDMHAQ